MKNFKIFSSTANIPLAEKICQELGRPLGKVEIVRFADSEARVRIEEKVTGLTCFVIASLSNPVDNHLIEFCLIVDALKQSEAGKIVAVVPYFGYGRQDKVYRSGEGVSARVMAKIIEAVGVNKLITVDLHSEAVAAFFNIPTIHLFGSNIFLSEIKKLKNNLVIVSPDAGAAKRAQKIAEELGVPLVLIEKKRNLEKIHTLDLLALIGKVKNKNCCLVDDIITGGGTINEAASLLRKNGARKIFACATHPDFVQGTKEKLEKAKVEKIYVSDTILLKKESCPKNLRVVSISTFLAKAISQEVCL